MKEELIRVLNTKLDNIKVNFESLTELNGKIDEENGKLSYAHSIVDIFKKENEYDVLKFTDLSKTDFDNAMDLLDSNIKEMFGTNSCNYDGLVYLINGINNGVSLSLTLEQENAINYFLQGMEGKIEEYEAVMDGLLLVKDRFEIADVNVLKQKEKDFEQIIDKFSKNDYVKETDEVLEAINYNELEDEKVIELLTYLLKYNADVYNENKGKVVEPKEEEPVEFEEPVNQPVEPQNVENDQLEEFHFPEFENIETDKINNEEVALPKTDEEENVFVPPEVSTENEKVDPLPVVDVLPMTGDVPGTVEVPVTPENENSDFEGLVTPDDYEEYNIPEETKEEEKVEVPVTTTEEPVQTPENNAISPDSYQEETKEEKISSRELKRLFKEFDVKFDNEADGLLVGNIDNYRNVLSFLKNNSLTEEFEKNDDLFVDVLTCSSDEELMDVINIIKNELSVDDEDYKMTLKIAVNTIPSIFVRDGGNYENFVRNVKMFKDMGINLVSLFDFSKEVFVADHNNLVKNYGIVKNYNVNLDYKNLKYMLMLPNIGEKIDYYVESVYPDRTKNNEKFDGITYVNNYPNKLNTVQFETIKRLRYSSENSKKVFGNKPNSLAGEITNLKVNVLEISPEYMNNFFDNKFDTLTSDEVREYTKLCRNSSNVGNFTDELAILEQYHNGLRYTINNVHISYNKVIRNYNTLRSYGIDKKKALLFAVCYNLVITNDEYNMIKKVLEERDGE